MKIALVHDYLKEFGGAERVLKCLSEIFPKAPIYTAFCVKDSSAWLEFRDREIYESFLAPILKIDNFYSPLRFLTPIIWKSLDLSGYDLVIASSSWYITRGFEVGPKTKVICYCHTPPRWLYGYETSVGFQKYLPVKVYAAIVGHFLRMYDFKTAQKPFQNSKFPPTPRLRRADNIQNSRLRQGFGGQASPTGRQAKLIAGVDFFIANSKNVAERIKKFYRRDSVVIYPPVDVSNITKLAKKVKEKEDHFLIVSRLVGAKGLEEAARAFKNLPYKLKIVGEAHGFSDVERRLERLSGGNVELLGRVSDEKLWELYAKAKGFIALAKDEDFGMTPVEAMAAGTPVIAYNGGGFKESVIDGRTGILINDTDEKTISSAIERLKKIKWDKKILQDHAKRFSKEQFVRRIRKVITEITETG